MNMELFETLPQEAVKIRQAVFVEEQGYLACGEIDFDENCPHIWMCKEIGGGQ